ncbi:RhoGAP domain-containing protein [Reticulomyxa filosa]|uniref:RhoGAP domain-containing protein n=1 Tax=Reticulomyxa filosa TaxID=46433 RepID=X6NDT9_RETFI|nr:RhoGAP domain-containing protein [Reticulomyxa filosa]|eukprot:ETO23889.1 RhoGAP domain-containing protein [Reticulomyxa filosa]
MVQIFVVLIIFKKKQGFHNNNSNNSNGNINNNSNTNNVNSKNSTPINDNNANNSMAANLHLSPQNFVSFLLERYRALEADRNRCKKAWEECLQEKAHACQQVDQWKQRYEERTSQLERNELQRQQLKIDNENLKRYIQELEMKCSQFEIQPLPFQQLLQYQLNPVQSIDNIGMNKIVGNGSNNTTNEMTNSNANGTTTHNSPASSPEQQISPGAAIRNLYTTTSTSTSPPDGSHKHSNDDPPNGIGVSSSWTGHTRGHILTHEHDMNVNIGMDKTSIHILDCIHGHQGSQNNARNTGKELDAISDANRNDCVDTNELIIPGSHHVMGKKRKRFEIPTHHEPQSRKRYGIVCLCFLELQYNLFSCL